MTAVAKSRSQDLGLAARVMRRCAAVLMGFGAVLLSVGAQANGDDSESLVLSGEQSSPSPGRYSLAQLNAQNLWIVSASSGLNCRAEPSLESAIVYGALPRFTELVSFDLVGRRGVLNQGLAWLRVLPRGPANPKPCFVAADRRLIQAEYPDTTLVGALAQVPDDVTCSSFGPGLANRVRLVTLTHVVYLCAKLKGMVPVATIDVLLSFRRTDPPGRPPALQLSNPEFDPAAGGQFHFRNGSYSYLIDVPSFRYPTSYFSVVYPDGGGYDELILEWLD